MSFDTCVVSLDLNSRLQIPALRKLATKYTKAGVSIDTAMQIVLNDQLELAHAQERTIVKAVREAWAARPMPSEAVIPGEQPDLNAMFTELLAEEAAAKPASDDLNSMFGELLAEVSGVDPRPTVADVVADKPKKARAKAPAKGKKAAPAAAPTVQAITGATTAEDHIRKFAKTPAAVPNDKVRKVLLDAGQLAPQVAGILGEEGHLVTEVGRVMEEFGYKFAGFDGLKPTFTKPGAKQEEAAPERGAGAAAVSAAKNLAGGTVDVLDALGALFGGSPGTFGSGPVFNDETYAKAVPLFKQALAKYGQAGQDIRDTMRTIIKAFLDKFGYDTTAKMQPYIVRFTDEYRAGKHQGENNVADGTAGSVAGREEHRADEKPAAEHDIFDVSGAVDGKASGIERESDLAGRGERDGAGVSGRDAVADRETGDQRVRAPESGPDGRTTERGDTEGSGRPGREAAGSDRGPEGDARGAARARAQQGDKLEQQRQAADIPVKPGDRANIEDTLPYLLEAQRDDVAFAEARFEATKQGAMPGVLFTNGTGTGKTATGMGTVARQVRAGKTEGLIVVPNTGIAKDWIEFGARLGIDIKMLESTTENGGSGPTITTYANFGTNRTLADRPYDWLLADESHYLMASKDGGMTDALQTFRALTKHPAGFSAYSRMRNRDLHDQLGAITNKDSEAARELRRQIDERQAHDQANYSTKPHERPKAIFLSATPFAYVKSVDYAEGYLFNYPEDGKIGNSNQDGRAKFFVQHFGYRIRYHKLTEPDGNVDVGLMARQFNSYLKSQGALSGRMLEVDHDYGRRFIKVESALGEKIDEGMEFIREHPEYKHLYGPFMKQFSYLKRRYLLEAIKAQEALPIIQQHLDMGRKVVVIHDYKKGGASNPFHMTGINGTTTAYDSSMSPKSIDLAALAEQFKAERPDLLRLQLPSSSALATLQRAFPNALVHNGDVPEKQLDLNKAQFNSDTSGRDLIILQSDKGREGISLHDTTGKFQRVEVIVGMAAKPTALIQLEGRIYRTGQKSNAGFDYVVTGTAWERWTFAQTIAERTDIAEALAMGDDARAMKDAIVEAFENAGPHAITENDGTGGKARDRQAAKAVTDWDRARSYYYGQLKRNSSTKALEGKDYFATPEPVGLKMVEWADIRPGEDVLEPSAGHGAIARWFPTLSNKTINEKETELITRARLVVDGTARFVQGKFEDLNTVNKYDAIVMNPPFGLGGSMAIPHLAKAYQHLRDGGRIVALLPRGPAADGKLEKFLYGDDAPADLYMVADIELPSSTFSRAGTSVMTHIVILDKISDPSKAPQQVSRDYASAEDADELFERIQHSTVPGRVKTDQPIEIALEEQKKAPKKQPREAAAGATGAERYYAQFEFKHTKTGEQLYGAAMLNRTSMDTYKQANSIAKQHDGYYNKFVGGGALRGFLFKSDGDRAAFMAEAGELAEVKEGHDQADDAGGMTFENMDRSTHTVQVDGVRRPIEDSRGQLVASDMNKQLNFWRWAGDTKVVDDQGRPLVVYHGTTVRDSARAPGMGDIKEFDRLFTTKFRAHSGDTVGSWFSTNPGEGGAQMYSGTGSGAAVYPVYLAIRNPQETTFQLFQRRARLLANGVDDGRMIGQAEVDAYRKWLKDMGKDGIKIVHDDYAENGSTEFKEQTAWIALEPEQVKSATGNNGQFDPTNPRITEDIGGLMTDSPLAAGTEAKRVATTAKLKMYRRLLEEGKITAEQHADRVNDLIGELDARNEQRDAPKPRERGPEWIEERLMRAARTGELNRDEVAFARWLLTDAPHLAEDLGISLRERKDSATGMYNHISRVITLFKGQHNNGTVVHEILHHTERMMPNDIQAKIEKAWGDAWARAYDKGDEKTRAALIDMIHMATDREARERVHKAFSAGLLNYDEHYQLANPSEFWAVNATRLMKARYTSGSWIGKAKQWLRELVEKAKGMLRLPSDAPVLAGLRSVMDGTGAMVSPLMLAERQYGRQLKAKAESIAANDDTAAANTSPLTMAARKRFNQVMVEAEHWLKSNGKTASLADLEPRWAMDSLDMMASFGAGKFSEAAKEQGRAIWDRAQTAYKQLAQRGGDLENGTTFENIGPRQLPAASWSAPVDTASDRVLHALQDKHVDMKRTVQAVRDTIGELGDRWDPYLQEELFHGRSATGFKNFLHDELRPLLSDMQARGVSMDDLEEFLHMRHAGEANARLASINDGNPDGLAGVSTQDAADYLANLAPQRAAALGALANRVDAIIKGTQEQMVEYGLEKQETVDTWNATYQHYVPLHREDMDNGQMGNGTGRGFSVKGSASQARTGSKRNVVHILANIALAREKIITRGEKNRVSMSLYGLALQAPNPTFWKPINPQKNRAALEAELLAMGLSPAEADAIVDAPRKRRINPNTGMVESYVSLADRKLPNVMAVRINGEDRFLFFNERDERAIRMAHAINNFGEDALTGTMGVVAAGTRYFAAVNTQFNPVFGVVNLVRDVGEGSINLSSTPIAGKQAQVLAEAGILLAKVVKGRGRLSNLSGPDLALWHEFEQEGGITGFRAMFARSEDRNAELARELNPDLWMESRLGKVFTAGGALKVPISSVRKYIGAPVFDWLSDYNEALENITRLSAYKVAKAEGMSNQQAASLAKNLTVNFNRKGAKTRILGALYAFFNASVQGTARMAQTLSGPAGKKIIAGGLFLGVAQALLLAVAGFDDDDIPDFIRAKNLIIPTGGKSYATIPLPLGFAFLPALGRIGTEFALHGGKHPAKYGVRMLSTLLDTASPVGTSTPLQMVSPTVFDPLAALSENKDWTGKPIGREDFSKLHPTPGHTRAKETASAAGKVLSRFFNAATGGSEYAPGSFSPTPDQIDYLLGQFTGGVGREAMKLQTTVAAKINGEENSWDKVPLFGRFYGDVNDKSAISTKFYNNVKELADTAAEVDGRRKAHVDTKDYRAEHPEWKIAEKSEMVLHDLGELGQRRRHYLELGDKMRVKEYELKIRTRMQKFNDEVVAQRATAK